MADEEPALDTSAADAEGAPETVVEAAETPELDEIDTLASELGWRPKDQWDGPEGEWTDSRAFLRKSREIARSQSRELKDMKRQLEKIGTTTSRMTTLALQQQRDELLARREEAFETGDKATFDRVDGRIKEIDKLSDDGLPPEGQDFAQKHASWFGKDQEATSWAVNRTNDLAKQGLSAARQLAIVEREARELFPEHFPEEKPVKKPPSLGAPQRTVSTAPREKGYATLPPAARKACDDWVRTQHENGQKWASKDTWAANFYAQEATNG